MAILVTGGAGFIGSHVCERLLEKGEKVVCIDNLNSFYDPRRKLFNIQHLLPHPDFAFFVKNVVERKKIKDIFEKFDISTVIHLAARAGVRQSLQYVHEYQDSNVAGTVNLLALASEHHVRNFVFACLSSVYGERDEVPFK